MESCSAKDPKTYAIIGAAMVVHQELGHGFLEPVYQAALQHELKFQNIPFRREVTFPVLYKGEPLSLFYRADFVCFESIIIELKALSKLTTIEESQIINYLKVTKLQTGLLLNFGYSSLQFKRYILSREQ